MPANFENLRLRYDIGSPPLDQDNQRSIFDFNLTSLNFDINQTTIGSGKPFTAEMSFRANFETTSNSTANDIKDLFKQVDYHFAESDPPVVGREKILRFLREEIFIHNHFGLQLYQIIANNAAQTIASSTSINNLVILENIDEIEDDLELNSLTFFVKLKFAFSGINSNLNLVLIPRIWSPNPVSVNTQVDLDVATFRFTQNFLTSFNDQLSVFYELLFQSTFNDDGGVNDNEIITSIGRATDDITDSINNLRGSINTNLGGSSQVQLQSPGNSVTTDLALWTVIKLSTDELQFENYQDFMHNVLCGGNIRQTNSEKLKDKVGTLNQTRSLPFMNVDAYRYLKIATEAFVMVNCSNSISFTHEELEYLRRNVPLNNGQFDKAALTDWWVQYRRKGNQLPYLAAIRSKLADENIRTSPFSKAFNNYINDVDDKEVSDCYGILAQNLSNPCFLELIWSYWHEEAMLVQGMNAITRRFQNVRGPGKIDPLANMEIDPLRPLSNLLWGYLQDENNRLTVRRRAYEYNHHYGITLKGTATKNMRFADSRSKFIEAFHRLLNLTSRYYKQADDMTVRPDGFPILNALREVHLVLSEGAHNQYGDMPSVSRAEMLMQQWMFAQPQFREVLPTRVMVAFPEPWMDKVAALNNMMGWTQTNVLHFHYLGYFGEQLLLSIRFGNWSGITDRTAAANWANFWREQIQGYIHAYHAATGVDLSADSRSNSIDSQQPSVHLYRKLTEQKRGKKIA